jgi:flagellar P-ring protein FlgI
MTRTNGWTTGWTRVLLALVAVGLGTTGARASNGQIGTTIRELVRFESDGQPIELQGFGLVIGLAGTGDSSKELAIARPLAAALTQRGFPISPEELGKGKNVALVSVSLKIRQGTALAGDVFDVQVSTVYGASSLAGGELFTVPLGETKPNGGVYALASGMIDVDDPRHPTTGKVHSGGRLIKTYLKAPLLGTTFDLILKNQYAGHKSASVVAGTINQSYYGTVVNEMTPIAAALDSRTIRITVPKEEQHNTVGFVGDMLSWEVNPVLLKLPPRVIVNQASGTISLTGDVSIGAVVFSDEDLSITTIVPEIPPTPTNPVIQRSNATSMNFGGEIRPSEQTRLQDVLDGWNRMAVPIEKQIEVLSQLSRMGKLHAELIID